MITEDFNPDMFHDNLVRGISISVEGYSSVLRLDLDYILEWPSCTPEDSRAQIFRIVKGVVSFQDVTDLCVNIDWGDSGYTTAVCGPYIASVQREKLVSALRLPNYYRWKISFADERSSITFGASSISLAAKGREIKVDRQYLTEQEREG